MGWLFLLIHMKNLNSTLWSLLVCTLLITSCTFSSSTESSATFVEFDQMEWIDLTHSFDSTTLYWPNNPTDFEHKTDAYGVTELGYFYSSYSLSTPEHGGTHLDAPIHFSEGKLTADEIPVDNLIGKAVIIDVSERALQDRDYLISAADIEDWEKSNYSIEPGLIILFKTGYGKFYPDRENYFGTTKKGDEAIPELHFPGISKEAAELLVAKKIKAVGLDTPSLDYGQSKDFIAHQVLMGANIPGFENVANLNQIPANRRLYVMALPMKIKNGSGGPLRIIAGTLPLN